MIEDLRIKLKFDHTRYHASLRAGLEGVTAPPHDALSRCTNDWTLVRFPEVQLELRWRHLEVVDPRWTDPVVELKQARESAIRAKQVRAVEHVGARGGFQELVLHYTGGRLERVRDRKEAQGLIDLMDEVGIKVEQQARQNA